MARGYKTGGRKKGAKNKRTLVACELDGFAKNEGFPILREIFADESTPTPSVVDIGKYLIDRELGKAKQSVEHKGRLPVLFTLATDADAPTPEPAPGD
jgi:hypothetical protein